LDQTLVCSVHLPSWYLHFPHLQNWITLCFWPSFSDCTPIFTIYTSSAFLLHLQLLLCAPPFNFMLRVPLIFTNLAPLPHLFHVYFMHPHIYFTHLAYLLRAPPKSDNLHPLCICFSFFGMCLCITRCTSHITHAPYYCFFFTFIFFVIIIIIIIFSFLEKRENENVLNYIKLQNK